MKTRVFQFLTNLPSSPVEQFNEAFKLYQQSAGHNFSQVRFLNAAGYTKPVLENLLYDLKQLHNITDGQIRVAKRKAQPIAEVSPFTIPTFSKGGKGNTERQKFVKDNNIEVEGKTNKLLDPAIKKWAEEGTAKWNEEQAEKAKIAESGTDIQKNDTDIPKNGTDTGNIDVIVEEVTDETPMEEQFKTAPDEVKEYISLHDQFPFLDEDDCPEELKILVSDKRKHYRAYVDARKKLLVIVPTTDKDATPVAMTDAEIFVLASKAVDNFEVNQLIYDELDHYNTEKEILGKHPIFAERILKGKIEKMTMAEAAKRATNLDNYIRRDGNALKKESEKEDKDAAKISKLESKIIEWNLELSLVNAKLGVSGQ